jgi:N-acetylneuraminic acid mutarotase
VSKNRRLRRKKGTSWIGWLLLSGLAAVAAFYGLLAWSAEPPIAGWSELPDAPIPRFEAASAVVDDRLFLFTGYRAQDPLRDLLIATEQVHVFEPSTGSWTRRADAPYPVTHWNAAVDGTDIWFAGGFEGNHPGKPLRQVWKYDTLSDTWTSGPPLPEARGGGALVRVGRSLHYIGGYFAADREPSSEKHWSLALAADAEWEPRASLPISLGHAGVAALDDRVILLGGSLTHHPTFVDTDVVQLYDAREDRWQLAAPMPSPRSHFEPGTFVADGYVYVFGGRDNMSGELSAMETREVLRFDVEQNRWEYLPGLPVPLRAPVAHKIGDKLYLSTGSTFWANEPQTASYVAEFSEFASPTARVAWSGRVRTAMKDIARRLPLRVQYGLKLQSFAE